MVYAPEESHEGFEEAGFQKTIKKTITLSVNARGELHLFHYCHNTMNLEFSNQTPRSMKFNIYLEFSKPP